LSGGDEWLAVLRVSNQEARAGANNDDQCVVARHQLCHVSWASCSSAMIVSQLLIHAQVSQSDHSNHSFVDM